MLFSTVNGKTMIVPYNGVSPRIASNAFIAEGAHIIGNVHIGEHSSVWFNCVLRGDCYYIRIGESTNIQDGTVVHVTQGRFPTIIGDHVTVGHSAVLHGCTVKDRCLVGIGAIVLDDVTIGEESFIAAGSLVTPGTVIPPRSMVMGSPAKVRRQVTDEEIARIDEHWQHYVEYKSEYVGEQKALRIENRKMRIENSGASESMMPRTLAERLITFAARVGKVVDALPDTRMGRHIGGQLVRCGTSPAPNYEEARAAESRADFIHKLGICLKELRESGSWILLIIRSELLPEHRMDELLDECEQLSNIIGRSIVTAKRNKNNRR